MNYHLTRKCNYQCGFCFHTDIDSHVETYENARRGLHLLKEEGMQKINFAGGEPFLEAKLLGMLCQEAKETLNLAVSIVTNGSKVKEGWMKQYGRFVDIIAVSCDSFDEATNIQIGRGKGDHLKHLKNVRDLCKQYNIRFKINTVVTSLNWKEDMQENIAKLDPMRWKVFQVLIIEGENDGNGTKRDARDLMISNEDFQAFCDRHQSIKTMVPESNDAMRSSYLLLDEHMRFLNCSQFKKTPTDSILVVGVQNALSQSGFDRNMFYHRGGLYDYTTSTPTCSSSGLDATDIEDIGRVLE